MDPYSNPLLRKYQQDAVNAAAARRQGDPSTTQWQDGGYIRNQAQQGIAGAQSRETPQAQTAPIANQFGGRLDTLTQRLAGIAGGQQQGAGELAAQRQGQMALANAIGAANMARGANAGNAGRAAARSAAGIGLQTSGLSQQAAMQDQQAAGNALLGAIGQGQSNELARAGLDQQTRLANLQARLQAMGLNDQAIQGYLSALGGMNQSEMAARLNQANQPSTFDKLLGVAGPIGAAALGG